MKGCVAKDNKMRLHGFCVPVPHGGIREYGRGLLSFGKQRI